MPKGTRQRSIRIADHLWHAAVETARERDENLSDEIRRFLERYVQRGAK